MSAPVWFFRAAKSTVVPFNSLWTLEEKQEPLKDEERPAKQN